MGSSSNFNPSKTRDFKPQGAMPVQLSAPAGPRLGGMSPTESRPVQMAPGAGEPSGPRAISRPSSDRTPAGGRQVSLAGSQPPAAPAPVVVEPQRMGVVAERPAPRVLHGEEAYRIEVVAEDANGMPYVAEMGEASFPVGTKILGMRHTRI